MGLPSGHLSIACMQPPLAQLHAIAQRKIRLGYGCNPLLTFLVVSPIEFNGTYFRGNMARISSQQLFTVQITKAKLHMVD